MGSDRGQPPSGGLGDVVTTADHDPAESVGERPGGQVVVEVDEQREVGAVGYTGGAEQRARPGEPHLERQAGIGGDDHQVGWDDSGGVTISGERRVDRRLCRLAGIAQQVVDIHEVQRPSLQSPPMAPRGPSRRSLLRPHPVHLPTETVGPEPARPPHEPGWGAGSIGDRDRPPAVMKGYRRAVTGVPAGHAFRIPLGGAGPTPGPDGKDGQRWARHGASWWGACW